MTAYGASISLHSTIDYILHSSHFILVGRSRDIIKVAYNELQPLQEILERLDKTSTSRSRKKVNALDGRIKETVWEFEDKLESIVTAQILSQIPADQVDEEMKERAWELEGILEFLRKEEVRRKFSMPRMINESQASQSRSLEDDVGGQRLRFSIDLHCLQDHVRSFIDTLNCRKSEYIHELLNMPDDDEDESISSMIRTKSKMIGMSDQLQQLKRKLMESYYREFFALVGTAGVGKTALAEAVYEDPGILSRFECRAWVKVGRKSQLNQVSRAILAQICGITQGDDIIGDDEIGHCLEERLEDKKCLIVLDDVWEKRTIDSLISFFENIHAFFIILVTTRDKTVVLSFVDDNFPDRPIILVRFLDEKESEELLCEKVFGENICPPQLDKAATKIAKNCEGLPLMIVTVADILSKAQNWDPNYWDDVVEMRNSIFTDAYNQITKVLFPSYDYLPQYLKMPFLYLESFLQIMTPLHTRS